MSALTTPQRELERESLTDECDRARRRLDDAVERKERSAERYETAQGTHRELDAYVQLQEDEEEVAARGRWLDWAEGDDVVPPWPDFVPLHQLIGW
jgi:hypothetical protein